MRAPRRAEEDQEMDTPERSKIGAAPLSKFEDSPVFNFISNLSPIQPVKSVDSIHVSNTYQSLNYASLTSIFSSPHANPQKDSKILSRSPFTDISRQQSSSDNAEENNLHTGVAGVRLSNCTTIAEDNCIIACPGNEATNDPPVTYHSLPSSSTQSMQYDGGSPIHNTTPCYGIKMDDNLDVEYTPVELIHVENGLERRKVLFSTETSCHENNQHVQDKDESVVCEWVNLISENDESLLVFDSSAEPRACINVEEEVIQCDADNLPSLHAGHSDDNTIQEPMISSADLVAEDGADDFSNDLSKTSQNQVDNQQQRGTRRRCLVFEMAGVSRGLLYNDSNLNPSRSVPFKSKSVSSGNYPMPAIRPLPCALPGIGLHLNTLASTSTERTSTKQSMVSGNRLITTPNSIGCFPPMKAGQENLSKFKDNTRSEVEDIKITHDEVLHDKVGNSEELSQGSPKKKRRRSENDESDGCKRCNCKKSKCLKLYCECFAAGVYCSEPCSCQGCFNKPIHEETVLATRKQIESRNPLAFAPKVIRSSEAGQEMPEDENKTPASARHKRGCNCKKSSCLKKYCECYQGGVGCSVSCRCEGCKNAFGKKEGNGILALVTEELGQGEEQNNSCEKETNELSDSQQNADVHIDEHLSHEDAVLVTPLKSCRLPIDLPFFSSAKPPRSSKLSFSKSSGLIGSHMLLKSEALLLGGKIEKNVNIIAEDDTPAILRGTTSPGNGMKTSSPNSKRISPPHTAIGLSPNRKGGRKLILRSIPSCPLLSNDVSTENPVDYSNSSFTSSALN